MSLTDFSWYRGNLTWLPSRTIFLTRHGSHAYGTNLPDSDLDLKGIAIAPREYYLGFLKTFEQAEEKTEGTCSTCGKGRENTLCSSAFHVQPDAVIYDIRKFWKLAADCNPNIIEVLFTDRSDWILPTAFSADRAHMHWAAMKWGPIYENRHLFLSQNAGRTFSKYAIDQLKRLQTHRGWLLNPPKKKPERSDFGLSNTEPTIGKERLGVIEAEIRKDTDTLAGRGHTKDAIEDVDRIVVSQVAARLELDMRLIPVIIAERKYAAAARYYDSYQKWKTERNPRRAETEEKFGYDTKHAMHLVRLLRMAGEILGQGQVLVRRPDAEGLLEIRRGAWTYEELMEYATKAEAHLDQIFRRDSPLPKEPDRAKLDQLLVEIVSAAL
jgi:hypothetical protein